MDLSPVPLRRAAREGAPVPDPQNRGDAAETGESDALRRVRDSGENGTVSGAQQHVCT